MSRIKITIIAILLAIIPANATHYAAVRDSMLRELAKAQTTPDSLALILNIFDASSTAEQRASARKIYEIARRAHNLTVQMEMLRRGALMAEGEKADSIIKQVILLAKALPESETQIETLLYCNLQRTAKLAETLDKDELREYFYNEMSTYDGDENASDMEKVCHHFAVCQYLLAAGRSAILPSDLEHLGELISKYPTSIESVRNIYFLQAGDIYTALGKHEKAIANDRALLECLSALADRYHKAGRVYRNFDLRIYKVLARMLMNYPALKKGEADSIYARMQALRDQNADVAREAEQTEHALMFYALAKGDYASAIPVMLRQMNNPANEAYRFVILRSLVDAAKKTGDNATLLKVMPLYIDELERRNAPELLRTVVDREVEYRLSDYQRNEELLDHEVSSRQKKLQTLTVVSVCVITVVLVVFLVILFRLYRRARTLSRNLEKTNADLIEDRDKLRRSEKDLIAARDKLTRAASMKDDFINNISREVKTPLESIVEYSQFIVDNMEEGRRKYMQNFADVITLSADLLRTLVNDVLNISSMEKNEVEINRRPVSVMSICNMAVGNMRNMMHPGVELVFLNQGESDSIITADAQRVDQVLINLLSNAAKFTEEGHVELSYKFSLDRSQISFIVTDTGIGIPKGKEEKIFQRFEKLDNHTQGLGLGLYISSLVTKLMKGEIKVDTTYTGGARFIFTIPTN